MLLLQRLLQLGCATVCELLEPARLVVRFACERWRLDIALFRCQKISLQLFSSFARLLQRGSQGHAILRRRFLRFLFAGLTRLVVVCVYFGTRRREFVRDRLQLGPAILRARLQSARFVLRLGSHRRLRLKLAPSCREIPLQLAGSLALLLQRSFQLGSCTIRGLLQSVGFILCLGCDRRWRLAAGLLAFMPHRVSELRCVVVGGSRCRLRKPYRCVPTVARERTRGEGTDERVPLRLL